MIDGTTNIPFIKQQQVEFRRKILEESKNRLLEIELGMPTEIFFKTHNIFGVRVRW